MKPKNPILISVPHSGTEFPAEVLKFYDQSTLDYPEDTDWYIDQLYSFSKELGIEMVVAPYSRYVIDLNRNSEDKKLYSDGRGQTSLVPANTFSGKALLTSELPQDEVKRRIESYYKPYYADLENKLQQRVQKFGKALLFDAHSIKRNIKTIQEEDFPDLILGNADESSASKEFIACALKNLSSGPFNVSHNKPFKGGNITRHFGRPEKNIHALQLEMSQDLYMDEKTTIYSPKKSKEVIKVLDKLFRELLKLMES